MLFQNNSNQVKRQLYMLAVIVNCMSFICIAKGCNPFSTDDLEKNPDQLDHYMVEGIVIIEKRNKV